MTTRYSSPLFLFIVTLTCLSLSVLALQFSSRRRTIKSIAVSIGGGWSAVHFNDGFNCLNPARADADTTNVVTILPSKVPATSASSPSFLKTPTASPLDNTPFAPPEALIPMTRFREKLKRAVAIAGRLGGVSSDVDECSKLLQQLQAIVAPPAAAAPRRTSVSKTRRYQMDNDLNLVKKQDSVSFELSGSLLRASMNVYTANLRFGETYVLTASLEDKKRMIRQDRLPTVRQVIAADLDLRDLYRNQAQTLLDDLAAELYQNSPDDEEIYRLLCDIQQAVDKWFGMIRESDIQQAIALAKKENE